MVRLPNMRPWSSDRAMMGEGPAPKWVAVDRLPGQFGMTRTDARHRYRHFVPDGEGQRLWGELRQQIVLGNYPFVKRMQAKAQVVRDPEHSAGAAPIAGAISCRHRRQP